MRIYECKNKQLLRFSTHGVEFIKQYSTNTPDAPRNAFIDLKGRVVALFDQHRVSSDEIWVIIERSCYIPLMQHLEKYLPLTSTKIILDEAVKIYWILDNSFGDNSAASEIWIPQNAGMLRLARRQLATNVTEEEMNLFRLKNRIVWQNVDFTDEMILSVVDEDRISYTKGCYLGQEIVARVYYKGKPPKKISVKKLSECTPEQAQNMTSKAKDDKTGEIIGFVFDKVE